MPENECNFMIIDFVIEVTLIGFCSNPDAGYLPRCNVDRSFS